MAGGGGGLQMPERQKRGDTGRRKKRKRVGFHLDMTPLVDITFLLLTFFMFTTTMASPQVMEMTIPPEREEGVDVEASRLLSIYIRYDNELFFNMGVDDPEPMELKDVKPLSVRKNLEEGLRNRLIIVLKISEDADYGRVVSVLDELNLAETMITEEIMKETDPETGEPMKRQRRFTIAKLTEEDKEKISDEYQSSSITGGE